MTDASQGSTRDRGRAMEARVAAHLVAHGLEIVDRNYTAAGAEIDLVAREDRTYVFVEVRSRGSIAHGSALETVGVAKQRRIVRAATAWLVAHDLWERVEVRFDVVAVEPGASDPAAPAADPAPSITWLRAAFEVGG